MDIEKWENDPMIDRTTGIRLTPSTHGINCTGNGEHPGYECCCDECDYLLICFPEWDRTMYKDMDPLTKSE